MCSNVFFFVLFLFFKEAFLIVEDQKDVTDSGKVLKKLSLKFVDIFLVKKHLKIKFS